MGRFIYGLGRFFFISRVRVGLSNVCMLFFILSQEMGNHLDSLSTVGVGLSTVLVGLSAVWVGLSTVCVVYPQSV